MLYAEFIQRAMDETIVQADNGLWYLEPMWDSILTDCKLECTERRISNERLQDILKLEVEKRNTIESKKPFVLEWFYNVITSEVQPAMLAEETDYVKAVTEFMKQNHNNKTAVEKE